MNILKKYYQENNYQEYFNYFLKNHKNFKEFKNNELLELNKQFSELIINNNVYDISLNAEKEINVVNNRNKLLCN